MHKKPRKLLLQKHLAPGKEITPLQVKYLSEKEATMGTKTQKSEKFLQ